MTRDFISFLVLMNPFALFLYLAPVMKELGAARFLQVLFRASIISFVIFAVFALTGAFIFSDILKISFEAFRIFGGIIIFTFAFLFIVQGKDSLIAMKEDLDDLAAEIALPFMIGAGTITVSIVIGDNHSKFVALGIIFGVLAINYLFVIGFMYFRARFKKNMRVAFDKNMGMFLRLNGFFVGAIGLDMIIRGIINLNLW